MEKCSQGLWIVITNKPTLLYSIGNDLAFSFTVLLFGILLVFIVLSIFSIVYLESYQFRKVAD